MIEEFIIIRSPDEVALWSSSTRVHYSTRPGGGENEVSIGSILENFARYRRSSNGEKPNLVRIGSSNLPFHSRASQIKSSTPATLWQGFVLFLQIALNLKVRSASQPLGNIAIINTVKSRYQSLLKLSWRRISFKISSTCLLSHFSSAWWSWSIQLRKVISAPFLA